MQATMTMPTTFDFYSVAVPHVESKKFKAIVKALGFDCVLRKKNGLDMAIEDIHAGRVETMTSIDEFIDNL